MGRRMSDVYENMLARGEYENENELCNDLALNYDDLYEDDGEDDDD